MGYKTSDLKKVAQQLFESCSYEEIEEFINSDSILEFCKYEREDSIAGSCGNKTSKKVIKAVNSVWKMENERLSKEFKLILKDIQEKI